MATEIYQNVPWKRSARTISPKQDSDYTGSDNTSDSTSRITLQSHQKAVSPNHYAETIRLDLMRDSAKNMIAWRNAYTDPANPYSVAWIGAHYKSNDGLSDHNHFSIEVTDASNALQTRLEIPFGVNTTNIKTSSADFTVTEGQNLRLSGSNASNKDFQYSLDPDDTTKVRWSVRTDSTTESGSNVGSDWRVVRHADDGSATDSPLFIKRSNGRVGIGGVTAPSTALEVLGEVLSSTTSNGTISANRAATTNFASYVMRTAGTDRWTIGLRNDSTNDFHFRDNINSVTPLKITQAATATITLTGNVVATANVAMGGSLSGTPSTSGKYLNIAASTFTDSNTAASGTATTMVFNDIARPTLAATNASVTTTNAINLYIPNGPLAGTNQTITNSYALLVGGLDAGSVAIPAFAVRGDGRLSFNAVPSSVTILNVGTTGGGGFSTTSTVTGINIQPVNSGTGIIIGHHVNPVSTVSGTVADITGVRSTIRTANAGLTLTAAKNFHVATPTISSGAITTAYGLYIDQQKISGVTTGYGVYQVNSTDNNYFAGNVGIGQITTSARLHLPAGTATAGTAPVKFTSGTITSVAVPGQAEYNGRFILTESDSTNRFIVQAAASTKTTAGAPYTNDGYVTITINGTDVKVLTTA